MLKKTGAGAITMYLLSGHLDRLDSFHHDGQLDARVMFPAQPNHRQFG